MGKHLKIKRPGGGGDSAFERGGVMGGECLISCVRVPSENGRDCVPARAGP